MTKALIASLPTERIASGRPGSLCHALHQLGRKQFSACGVDAYKLTVINMKAEAAQKVEAARRRHYCDVARRNEYLVTAGVCLVIGLIAGSILGLVAKLAVYLAGGTVPYLLISGIIAGVLSVLFFALFNIFLLQWPEEISLWRSYLYLIPGVQLAVGTSLELRAKRNHYIRWDSIPFEEFDQSVIPEPIRELCAQIRRLSPNVRLRVHFTAVDVELMHSRDLKEWAYYHIDPFVSGLDADGETYFAVWKESGFRLA